MNKKLIFCGRKMNTALCEITLKEGDITLVGNDGEVRIFSHQLKLIPYFEAQISFNGKMKDKCEFPQFGVKELRGLVGFIHGKMPKDLNDRYLETLDFFQLDFLKQIFESYELEKLENISVQWIIRMIGDEGLVDDYLPYIVNRIRDEMLYKDIEIWNWLTNKMIPVPLFSHDYTEYCKMCVIVQLIAGNYKNVEYAAGKISRHDDPVTVVMELCVIHPEDIEEEFMKYIKWKYRSVKKTRETKVDQNVGAYDSDHGDEE